MDKLSKAGANPCLVSANEQPRMGGSGGLSSVDAGDEAQQRHSQEGPCNNGPFLVSVSVPCVSWSHVSEANRLGTYLHSPQQYRSQP